MSFLLDPSFEFLGIPAELVDPALVIRKLLPEASGFIRLSLVVFDAHASGEQGGGEE